MGALFDKVSAVPRDTGGQRHCLVPLLARMDPEDADDLKLLLADPTLNVAALATQMAAKYGTVHSPSTWKRWSKEVLNGRRVWETS